VSEIDKALIHVVRHNTGNINNPPRDDFPFRLTVSLKLDGTIYDYGVMLEYGATEEVDIQGKTLEALEPVIQHFNFRGHARLISMTVTGPGGVVEQLPA